MSAVEYAGMKEEIEVRATALELAIAAGPEFLEPLAGDVKINRTGQLFALAMKFEAFLWSAVVSHKGSDIIKEYR